jgi:hypothetical protein
MHTAETARERIQGTRLPLLSELLRMTESELGVLVDRLIEAGDFDDAERVTELLHERQDDREQAAHDEMVDSMYADGLIG